VWRQPEAHTSDCSMYAGCQSAEQTREVEVPVSERRDVAWGGSSVMGSCPQEIGRVCWDCGFWVHGATQVSCTGSGRCASLACLISACVDVRHWFEFSARVRLVAALVEACCPACITLRIRTGVSGILMLDEDLVMYRSILESSKSSTERWQSFLYVRYQIYEHSGQSPKEMFVFFGPALLTI
jgi:hypothetical protein